MPGTAWECSTLAQPHEAHTLRLDSSKACSELSWLPRWSLAQALQQTVSWHEAWRAGADMHERSLAQIADFERAIAGNTA